MFMLSKQLLILKLFKQNKSCIILTIKKKFYEFDKKAGDGEKQMSSVIVNEQIFFPVKSSLQHISLKNRTNIIEKLINSV